MCLSMKCFALLHTRFWMMHLKIVFLISRVHTHSLILRKLNQSPTEKYYIVIEWSAGRESNPRHLRFSHKCHEHVSFPLWFVSACILKTPNGKKHHNLIPGGMSATFKCHGKVALSSICNTAQHSSGHKGNICLCVCVCVCVCEHLWLWNTQKHESAFLASFSLFELLWFYKACVSRMFPVWLMDWNEWWPSMKVLVMQKVQAAWCVFSLCQWDLMRRTQQCSDFECEDEKQPGDGQKVFHLAIRYFHGGWHFDRVCMWDSQTETAEMLD